MSLQLRDSDDDVSVVVHLRHNQRLAGFPQAISRYIVDRHCCHIIEIKVLHISDVGRVSNVGIVTQAGADRHPLADDHPASPGRPRTSNNRLHHFPIGVLVLVGPEITQVGLYNHNITGRDQVGKPSGPQAGLQRLAHHSVDLRYRRRRRSRNEGHNGIPRCELHSFCHPVSRFPATDQSSPHHWDANQDHQCKVNHTTSKPTRPRNSHQPTSTIR